MTQAPKSLSVAALFAEREARRRNEQEATERLQRRKEEELAAYKQRLENFHLVDEMIPGQLERSSAPSSGGRASSWWPVPLRLLH